jgi:hypothetical protein
MQNDTGPLFDRPVFILAPPRSGTPLRCNPPSTARGVRTIGGESHGVMEAVKTPQACVLPRAAHTAERAARRAT